jgi:arginase
VGAAVAQGAFPVVLSGSCFASTGVVAGMAESRPGVVWFDAHADFNTPESTASGYFDGMATAILTGGAWTGMRERVPGAGPIPQSAVVLAGARDLDEAEERRLRESAITYLPPGRLGSDDELLAAVAAIDPSGLYLHVDLDVLDPGEGRVNIYGAAGGLSAGRLEALVTAVLERAPVRAVSLTAYDPECDPAGQVPPVALRLLRRVAERRAAD